MPHISPKIFAIGDIHDCHDKLVTLFSRIPYDKDTDTLVFPGDYINRGTSDKDDYSFSYLRIIPSAGRQQKMDYLFHTVHILLHPTVFS